MGYVPTNNLTKNPIPATYSIQNVYRANGQPSTYEESNTTESIARMDFATCRKQLQEITTKHT